MAGGIGAGILGNYACLPACLPGWVISQRSQYRKRLLYALCVQLFVWHFRFPEDDDTKFPFKWIAAPNEMKNSTRHWSSEQHAPSEGIDIELHSTGSSRLAALWLVPRTPAVSPSGNRQAIGRQLTSQTTLEQNRRPSSVCWTGARRHFWQQSHVACHLLCGTVLQTWRH